MMPIQQYDIEMLGVFCKSAQFINRAAHFIIWDNINQEYIIKGECLIRL